MFARVGLLNWGSRKTWEPAGYTLGRLSFSTEKYWSSGIFTWNQINATKCGNFTKTRITLWGCLRGSNWFCPWELREVSPEEGFIWIECWRVRQNDWDNLLEKKVCLGSWWSDFFLFVYLFVCLFVYGCVGSSLLCTGPLQLRRAGATLCRGARASHCGGLSLCGARAPGMRASVIVARGLSSCGPEALERRLSSRGTRTQLLRGMWDPPGPGLQPASPALAGRFPTTAPPGKPQWSDFYSGIYYLLAVWYYTIILISRSLNFLFYKMGCQQSLWFWTLIVVPYPYYVLSF